MNQEEIIQTLAEFIAAEILKQPQRHIQDKEPLISSGLVDSFSLVDLSLFVNDRFKVELDDTELNRDTFDTLHQLAQLILQRMN